jgi:hypothetical protein
MQVSPNQELQLQVQPSIPSTSKPETCLTTLEAQVEHQPKECFGLPVGRVPLQVLLDHGGWWSGSAVSTEGLFNANRESCGMVWVASKLLGFRYLPCLPCFARTHRPSTNLSWTEPGVLRWGKGGWDAFLDWWMCGATRFVCCNQPNQPTMRACV